MRIRRAVHGDVPGIYRCLSQMVTHLPTPESHNLIADSYFKQDWVYSVVAEVGEYPTQMRTVGFASVSFEMKIRGGIIGHIEDVVVDREWRRAGVGGALVEALKEEGRNRGAYQIYLECSPRNTHFYESHGFIHSGVSMRWDVAN